MKDNKAIAYEDFEKHFPELMEGAGPMVGEGWYPLIWEMFETLTTSRKAQGFPISDENPLYFADIKEKYGTLRAYPFNATDEDYKIISMFEDKSQFICETCGKSGKIRGRHWLYTACDEHTKKEDL